MHCSFCHGHGRTPRRMSKDEFSLILDKLTGHTKYIYYHLMGEPLTHHCLPDFIREAESRGFRSVVTTNGTLLKTHGRKLIDAGVYKVSISVHSFEDGSYDDLLLYMQEVMDFAKEASKNGIIVVLRLWNKGHDGGRNDAVYDILRSSIEGEWVENTRGIRIHDKLHLEWGDRFEWPDMAAAESDGEIFCYGLCDHFGILCDGTVVPCCLDSEGTLALGNIFDEDIGDILSASRARSIAAGFAEHRATEELCRKCGYARRFIKGI